MSLKLRAGKIEDAPALGRICYEAFRTIAKEHNFPPDFPNIELATAILSMTLGHPSTHSVVAELDGRIAGSNFLYEGNPICGVGPITVDPQVQNSGIGRQLMLNVIERSTQRGFAGIRLVQAGYHMRSLSLYTKIGFDPRQQLLCMQGNAIKESIAGYAVRSATEGDLQSCNALCLRVHGHHRGGELRDTIGRGTATVVERGGRITGYATQIAFFAHEVAETNDDMIALISAANAFDGPGFLVPSSNPELVRWCLSRKLRVTQPMTLMSIGLFNEPLGVYLPSVVY
jgi:predicted N-acetyltransferase YhbS